MEQKEYAVYHEYDHPDDGDEPRMILYIEKYRPTIRKVPYSWSIRSKNFDGVLSSSNYWTQKECWDSAMKFLDEMSGDELIIIE